MKKKIISFVLLVALTAVLTLGAGCGRREIVYDFEDDGVYKYYYMEEHDSYAIVGLVEEGEGKVLYIPPFFNGKPITQVGIILRAFDNVLVDVGGNIRRYRIKGEQEKVYYSYNSFITYEQEDRKDTWAKKSYIPYPKRSISLPTNDSYFLAKIFFKLRDGKYSNDLITGEKNRIQIKTSINYIYQYPANTTFIFNYEDAPNENYFFINDFERGGLIEDVPYEPTREGYEFTGWYKEPECINAWDFAVDTLPEPEYDEDGDLIFVETKLYAKWIREN